MSVVCNKPCKYRKATFCGLEYTMLNQFGQCVVWFDKNGGMRLAPEYRFDGNQKRNAMEMKKQASVERSENLAEEPKNCDLKPEKCGESVKESLSET